MGSVPSVISGRKRNSVPEENGRPQRPEGPFSSGSDKEKYLGRMSKEEREGDSSSKTSFDRLIHILLEGNDFAITPTVTDIANVEHSPLRSQICQHDLCFDKRFSRDKTHVCKTYFGILKRSGLEVDVFVKTVRHRVKRRKKKKLIVNALAECKLLEFVGFHENVIRFLGAEVSEISRFQLNLVFERSTHGTLSDYLRSWSLSESQASLAVKDYATNIHFRRLATMAHQIGRAMGFIASKGVVHGNLRAGNVHVFDDGNLVQVGDWTFGPVERASVETSLSKKKGKANGRLPHKSFWPWAALETLEKSEYSSRTDVWSFGVTLWEMFSLGKVPYEKVKLDENFIPGIRSGMLKLHRPEFASAYVWHVITECWDVIPTERPSIAELTDFFSDLVQQNISAIREKRASKGKAVVHEDDPRFTWGY